MSKMFGQTVPMKGWVPSKAGGNVGGAITCPITGGTHKFTQPAQTQAIKKVGMQSGKPADHKAGMAGSMYGRHIQKIT